MEEYKIRGQLILGFIAIVFFVFLIRFFAIQVFNTSLKSLAENNAIRKQTIIPSRGLIYDRNNKLMVSNKGVYDLHVIPRLVKNIDTVKFCRLLEIDNATFKKSLAKAKRYSSYRSSIFLRQIDEPTYLNFQEHSFQFPGFSFVSNNIREYHTKSGALLFGYIGEVNKKEITQSDNYYDLGDFTGKTGVEKEYEFILKGEKGYKYEMVDAFNVYQSSFDDGKSDVLPVPGADINLTIDLDLQEFAEELLQNKKGSIIALDPTTGEILTMASSPAYDPTLLNVRNRSENYQKLLKNEMKPLFNRAVMASYIPGSVFKPIVSLVALQEGAIEPNQYFQCGGVYELYNLRLNCSHDHPSSRNVADALKESCNPYFWQTFKKLMEAPQYENTSDALDKFGVYLNEFGLGVKLDSDLPAISAGALPTSELYNKWYGKNRWFASTIISLGIGQGEIDVTPLQMANLMSIIANKGYYYLPHLVKPFETDSLHFNKFTTRNYIQINAEHFEVVAEGLEKTVSDGTGTLAAVKGLKVAGKTGTADNSSGEPHSIFTGYAPANDPKIAVAVIIENGGFGSTMAAPITSLIVEKYLNGEIAKNRNWLMNRIIETNLIEE